MKKIYNKQFNLTLFWSCTARAHTFTEFRSDLEICMQCVWHTLTWPLSDENEKKRERSEAVIYVRTVCRFVVFFFFTSLFIQIGAILRISFEWWTHIKFSFSFVVGLLHQKWYRPTIKNRTVRVESKRKMMKMMIKRWRARTRDRQRCTLVMRQKWEGAAIN